ncbi:MAG: 2-C-methyl-D-erythritol 2,4-cyclodiphosphate synthase [Planctomycetaceae bacterium]|nr:2-C-methyl-D-erythritol 2,4-cyclodiphosphate synthase [Planctomycetaceae bacterium]
MIRIGLGHDTHRLEPDRRLVIGGIDIPHSQGAVAHSDGDVLLHAVTDALLGALGWGDIGEWFPDTDPAHAGADSAHLLAQVVTKMHAAGWHVINLDAIVFAQLPKLSPYKNAMTLRVAELLAIETEVVNVKAKTGERVGPVGREEALCAEVVVLIQHQHSE